MHAVLCMALHKHTDSGADEIHSYAFFNCFPSTLGSIFFIFIFPACIIGQLQGGGLLSYMLKT
jgi:hypothetical protein